VLPGAGRRRPAGRLCHAGPHHTARRQDTAASTQARLLLGAAGPGAVPAGHMARRSGAGDLAQWAPGRQRQGAGGQGGRMEVDLSAFHFLRPWCLALLPLAGFLWWMRRAERDAIWRDSRIAPALLPYLVVRAPGSRCPRPEDLLALVLSAGALAAAGPTWQRDELAFLDNVAPLMVAVDLSASMDSHDVPPSRLEAVRHTLSDLVARRAGARTGLIAYAGSSHLVLPPTDDANLFDLFTQALSTDLIGLQGRNVAGAIALGARVLAAERTGGTLLLVTDGADRQHLDAAQAAAQAARDMQVLVMAAGQIGRAHV